MNFNILHLCAKIMHVRR